MKKMVEEIEKKLVEVLEEFIRRNKKILKFLKII
jgi:hypothetical protein